MYFQNIIMKLHQYWAQQGCLLWQPYSEKVGAGTANPATVLRVLGPEPWNVAYVEPSYRPDDGRYAENPNRMQMHTQYQVILKPAPANVQQLYLGSLEYIGIPLYAHDIRFVEDNWESPALGAWGLGWEVWLDGLEITQFTYFQQAGGYTLDPVSVELTYGLERIAMFLQHVNEVWKIQWDEIHTYGDILRQSEIESCVYNFEVAEIQRLKQMYSLFEEEVRTALNHKLVIPAHDYLLRCSHTFNVMDARGAIGVTERAGYFARMRDLARQVASAYLERRQKENYPWLKVNGTIDQPRVLPPTITGEMINQPSTYLLEIGVEELPASDVPEAIRQLGTSVPKMLSGIKLRYEKVRVSGTPRRLVVIIESLEPKQWTEEVEIKGPSVNAAFDADGNPTPAANGFSRKVGVMVNQLRKKEDISGTYLYAVVNQGGLPAVDALSAELPSLIAGLRFEKAMRWNKSNIPFSRPVRWFVSLLGDTVVPFEFAGITASRMTYGPRSEGSPLLEVNSPDDYLKKMEEHHVIVDPIQRKAEIQKQVYELAHKVGGVIPNDQPLLDEVTNLVEQPAAVMGQFATDFLRLPEEVLITVMKKHQRYFPIIDQQQKLLPYFITVSNGGISHFEKIREGNENVLHARYTDALFFFKADTAHNFEDFSSKLSTLTFHENLGSMEEKAKRIYQLVPLLAPLVSLSSEDLRTTLRAAALFKNDLVTQMVIELTSLQGIMGRKYALLSGEKEQVAEAIFEHYLPRYSGDLLPQTKPGFMLGIANRLDSLVGLFACGVTATGSVDPFGLRRDAVGLLQVLIGCRQSILLDKAVRIAANILPVTPSENSIDSVIRFLRERFYGVLKEQGYSNNIINAVLNENVFDPYQVSINVEELGNISQDPKWSSALKSYARCKRLSRSIHLLDTSIQLDQDDEPLTKELYAVWQVAQSSVTGSVYSLGEALKLLTPYINQFFERVVVMSEDETKRQVRLNVIQRISDLSQGIADLTQLQGF